MKNGNSTFSTVDCIENLQKAGFTPEQAQAQARAIENSRGDLMSVLATKEDIRIVEKEIKGIDLRIANVESKIGETEKEIKELSLRIANVESKIGETEKEIIKYIGNQNLKILGVLGGLMAILKFLPDFFN